MEWLNYHHLLYFWVAARAGSVTKASRELRLSQSTVSTQIRLLEEVLGEQLFRRVGRGIELTDIGRVAYQYAEDIFSLGREFLDVVRSRPTGRPVRLQVGIADVVPKLMAHRLLFPALEMDESMRIVCIEGDPDELIARLATHQLDLVLSDRPIGQAIRVKAYNHLLGETGTSFFATPNVARRVRRRFPESLADVPVLLPTLGTIARRRLDLWFEEKQIKPTVHGEFEDSALLKVFGAAGSGAFPSPTALEEEICRQYRVQVVGRAPELRERYYGISVERRLKHPAVLAIARVAHEILGGDAEEPASATQGASSRRRGSAEKASRNSKR